VRLLLFPLNYLSAWAQTCTVVVNTSCEGAGLASVRLVGVGTANNYGGAYDISGRCSGLCSLGRRGLRQPLR
jgi:hypothetical protein